MSLPIPGTDCTRRFTGFLRNLAPRLRQIVAAFVRTPNPSVPLGLALALAVPAGAAGAADLYRAFYYNAQGDLLQVEQVPDADVPNRKLKDPAEVEDVPRITRRTVEKISGTNIPMSRNATLAVYYSYDGPEPAVGTRNVRARPFKIELLEFVPNRTVAVCLDKGPEQPCQYPQRCHCTTGACCCW